MNQDKTIKKVQYVKRISKKNKLSMIDLFAGTGGFTIAFQKTGKVNIVMANDMCSKSKQIYQYNFPDHNFVDGDLFNISNNDIPKADIITAGFPCQPFSIAGKQQGFQDERANVFWKILSIMKSKHPRFVILENVKNLGSHDKGKTFAIIQEEIKKLGYHIKYQIINTCQTKVPQNRERIYIVCFRYLYDYKKFDFDFQDVTANAVLHYLEDDIADTFYYRTSSKIWPKLEADITKKINTNTIYQYRRYYVRENKSGLCPTLTANMGTGGHNVPIIRDDKGIRKLTPRECFNLQGFPADYYFPDMSNGALYKLAGNAISVPVAHHIATQLVEEP